MENFKKYYKYGNEAEKRFVKSLQVYGFKNKKSSDHDDINNHWDYLVNFPFKVDVKSSKRLNKENIHPSDAYIVLEIKNVHGDKGSIYGDADFFAYELCNYFVLVCTKVLRLWIATSVDMEDNVGHVRNSYKKVYTRKGREDLMTILPLEAIKKMSSSIILKNVSRA